jgi:hypothetical protein
MGKGCCQKSKTMVFEIRLASSPLKIFESLCFFNVYQLQGFFYKYFVVKSHKRVPKLIVEFNDASKTALGSKIRTPYSELCAFISGKVRRVINF